MFYRTYVPLHWTLAQQYWDQVEFSSVNCGMAMEQEVTKVADPGKVGGFDWTPFSHSLSPTPPPPPPLETHTSDAQAQPLSHSW